MKTGFSQIIIFDGTSFDPSIDGVSLTTHSPKGDVTGVAFAPTYDISDGLLIITLKKTGVMLQKVRYSLIVHLI